MERHRSKQRVPRQHYKSDLILLVTDTRIGVDESGTLWTPTPGMAGIGWARGLAAPRLGLTARLRSKEPTDTLRIDTQAVYRLPYYVGIAGFLKNFPRSVLALREAVREAGVVVVKVPSVHGVIAVLWCLLYRKPIGVEVVGDASEVASSGALGAVGRIVSRPYGVIARWVVRQGDVVRYMTRGTLQNKYPATQGKPALAASSVAIHPDMVGLWEEKSKAHHPTILTIGSQETTYKGHDLLIRALPSLLADYPDIRLQLVGKGRRQTELRALSQQLGVEEHVDFLGYIDDRRAISELLAHAWLYAMPSRTEGLPRALVEACAAGTPAIGARVGGIPELLPEDSLFDNDNVPQLVSRIREMLASAERRLEHSERNKSTARWYTADEMASRLEEWNGHLKLLLSKTL